FQVGAVVSIVLLVPALAAFLIDRAARSRQAVMVSTKAVPYVPQPSAARDWLALAYCGAIAVAMLGMILVPGFTSLTKFWPYNLDLTLRNYEFDRYAGGGWQAYLNSLRMAAMTS